jgi:hypothetical protein
MTESETLEIPHWTGPRQWRRTGERYGRYGRVQLWRGTCCICGADFEIAVLSTSSKQFRRFACKAHRLSWQEAFGLWRKRKRRTAFKRAFEKIKARKLGS